MYRKVLLRADFQFISILQRCRRLHSNHNNSVIILTYFWVWP